MKSIRAVENSGSDDLLRALVDACVSNVAVLDESGKILYASRAWRVFEQDRYSEMAVKDSERNYFESCNRLTESEFDQNESVTLADDIQQILFGDETEFHRKYYFRSLAGTDPFLMHAARLDLQGFGFRVFLTHEEQVSERENLENRNHDLAKLLATTKILAWEGDVENLRFTYVSEQAIQILGYPATDWYEPNFLASHIHPEDRHWVVAAHLRQSQFAGHFDLTFRMLGSDGRVVWVQNLVSITDETGGARRIHGFMIDISERKRAEGALKDLGARLIAAQEEERKRIARELHDDLNQRMAVLSIELEQLCQKIQKPFSIRQQIQKLQLHAQEISNDIQRLSHKLHSSKLDHLGLAAAVKSLCDEISHSGKMEVKFRQICVPSDLPKAATLCVFRIAQESLRNCVKHSGADTVQVVLTKTNNAIHLSVSDNGCGFDTHSDVMEKGLGFISMKERLHLVEGEINIWSQPMSGTRIEVAVPLNRELATGEPDTVNIENASLSKSPGSTTPRFSRQVRT